MLSTCILHGCYFVIAAMSATFLQTPTLTRLILLLLVPLNAIAEIRHGVSLEMAPLTLILVAVALGKIAANPFIKLCDHINNIISAHYPIKLRFWYQKKAHILVITFYSEILDQYCHLDVINKNKCEVIKRNESYVGNIDSEI